MKYELDVQSSNNLREWSRVPRVFNSISEMVYMINYLMKGYSPIVIRIREVNDDNA